MVEAYALKLTDMLRTARILSGSSRDDIVVTACGQQIMLDSLLNIAADVLEGMKNGKDTTAAGNGRHGEQPG